MRSLRLLCLAVFFTVILVGPLYAASAAGKAEIAFSQALLAYDKGDYEAAEQGFATALQHHPSHYQAAYFLGMSYFQQKKYQSAIKTFDKAIALRKTEPEPYFYRGVSLYRQGLYEPALNAFVETTRLAPEGEMKELTDQYILAIESGDIFLIKGARQKPWFIYSNISFNYDSNVTLDPEDITLATLPSDQNDAQFVLQGGGGYHIVQKQNYRLTGQAYWIQTLYPDLSGFNYGLAHVEIDNDFRFGEKSFLKVQVANEFSILSTAKYLNSIQLLIHTTRFWTKWLMTRIGSRVRYNDFFQPITNPAQNRDAFNLEPGIAQFFYFRNGSMYVRLRYYYEHNFASGLDWDYQAHRVAVSFFSPVIWDISTYIYAEIMVDKDFNNVDSVLGKRRDDWGQFYSIEFSRPVHEYVSIRLHYSYRRNTSNLPVFQYDKHVAGATVSFRL